MWLAFAPTAAAEAPPPLQPDARFAIALFCNPTCSEEVVTTLDDGLASIASRDGFPDEATRPLRIMGVAGADFGIPDASFVELYGTGVDRPEELAKSQEILLGWFASPRKDAVATLTTAHAAFAAAAKASGGWVEDLDTQRLYGAEAWAALRPNGPLTDWFVVDAEPADAEKPDGNLRMVTRGLRRFGDFELVVEDVPPESAGDVSFVVNAIATDLHTHWGLPYQLKIDRDGVKGTATFRTATARDTDPEPPLLRATFEGEITLPPERPAVAETPPAPPVAVASAERPVATDAPSSPPPEPPPAPAAPTTLEEAQRVARERLTSVVLPAFSAGLPAGEKVAVKAPFRTRNGAPEYMWVELRSVRGGEVVGELMNEPWEVDGLHKGDTVTLPVSEVFDYVWKKGDGSREGNTTAAFLQ